MIAIYYIATNKYTMYAENFLDSIKYFWPNQEKTIVLIGTEELKQYEGERDGMKIIYNKETHYPWPVITLYKFYLMKIYKIEADYHFYFNANTIINEYQFDWSWFEGDEIKCSSHFHYENYIQAGCICIPNNVFDKFCDEHIRRVNHYTQKEFKIPEWHDETILNEMLLRDNFLPYKIFPHKDVGFRWLWYDNSPYLKCGLCYMQYKKKWFEKFKGWI